MLYRDVEHSRSHRRKRGKKEKNQTPDFPPPFPFFGHLIFFFEDRLCVFLRPFILDALPGIPMDKNHFISQDTTKNH
jgi:hypothetical protein